MSEREEMERNLKHMMSTQEISETGIVEISKMIFFRYQSFIDVGFSEEQAFDLIKTKGLFQ